jgi:predicted HicB family RNase H-like nuclease
MSDKKKTITENPKKRSKRNKLNLRIDDEDLETLNMISFEDDESISQIVRKAIRQYNTLRKNRKQF